MIWALTKRDWLRVMVLMILAMGNADCHRHPVETEAEILPAGEPEIYSATITRATVDGSAQETITGSIERRNDWRREQWTENSGAWAIIWRPDLGNIYLLDLAHQQYVESALAGGSSVAPPHDSAPTAPAAPTSETDASAVIAAGEVDRALNDVPLPTRTETHVLADQTTQDHPCQVVEERATFADGHIEITRSHRARDLAGLPLLIEIESVGGMRLTIERRDVRLDAAPDDFAIPAGFKKVARLDTSPK